MFSPGYLSHFSERDEELLKEVETYIDAVTALVPATDKRLREIRAGLLSDATCSKVIDYCTKGWLRIISADLVPLNEWRRTFRMQEVCF